MEGCYPKMYCGADGCQMIMTCGLAGPATGAPDTGVQPDQAGAGYLLVASAFWSAALVLALITAAGWRLYKNVEQRLEQCSELLKETAQFRKAGLGLARVVGGTAEAIAYLANQNEGPDWFSGN